MTGNNFVQLLLANTETLVCEHCQQEYGTIPEVEGIPSSCEKALLVPSFWYYKDRIHCVPCGMCGKYVQKETLHHPLADAPICTTCYQSFKDSDSCYTFEEDLGDFE